MSAMLAELDSSTLHANVVETAVPSQFVTFSAGNASYGVDIMAVREIRRWSPTTQLPDQPAGARGVMDIRGNIVQVFDLASLLGEMPAETKPGHVVIVVSISEINVGILVDSVSDIIFVKEENMRQAPAGQNHGTCKVSHLVKQDDQLIAILNLDVLFSAIDAN